jgi:Zn-dependent metalloprotease
VLASPSREAASAAVLEVYYGPRLVRKSGDKATGNLLVDATFDNLARVDGFVRRELGLAGWDNKNGPLRAQLLTDRGRNAYFDDKLATMFLGERNSMDREHTSFGFSATVIGHEVGHGIAAAMGRPWPQTAQEAAVDEHWADVMATGADDSNWVLGDELDGGIPGLDLRDLANPKYRRLQDIPPGAAEFYSPLMSYAAVLVANKIGKVAMRKLWFEAYKSAPRQLGENAMHAFADAVVKAAKGHAVQVVVDAYKAIGIY